MDTARQVLRYSVPGSVFVLFVVGAQLIFTIVIHGPSALQIDNVALGLVAAALAASIPLGFAIYQVYYAYYRPTPLGGRVATLDRGARILTSVTCEQRQQLAELYGRELDERSATGHWRCSERRMRRIIGGIAYLVFRVELAEVVEWKSGHCPEHGTERCYDSYVPPVGSASIFDDSVSSAERYRLRCHNNWNVIMAYLDRRNAAPQIKSEYTSLSDIYHALGAARLAIFASGFTFVLYNVTEHRAELWELLSPWGPWWSLIGPWIIFVGAAIFFVRIFTRARGNAQESMLNRVGLALRADMKAGSLD